MKETIISILKEVNSDPDYANSTTLIDDDDITSLDLVAIVGELNDEFDIMITVDDLIPENFNSVDAMVALVEELQG